MIAELRDWLKDDIVVGLAGFVFLFLAVFGAVNWHDHIEPNPPTPPSFTVFSRPETRQLMVEKYDRDVAKHELAVASVGQGAVISRMWAIPLTVVGFLAAVFAAGILIYRHCEY